MRGRPAGPAPGRRDRRARRRPPPPGRGEATPGRTRVPIRAPCAQIPAPRAPRIRQPSDRRRQVGRGATAPPRALRRRRRSCSRRMSARGGSPGPSAGPRAARRRGTTLGLRDLFQDRHRGIVLGRRVVHARPDPVQFADRLAPALERAVRLAEARVERTARIAFALNCSFARSTDHANWQWPCWPTRSTDPCDKRCTRSVS